MTSSACPKEHDCTERSSSNPSPVHIEWQLDQGLNRDFKITNINLSNTVTSRVQMDAERRGKNPSSTFQQIRNHTLYSYKCDHPNPFRPKFSLSHQTTRIGFVVFQRSHSGGPDTVPSTACEQQSETPVNMTHILRGRLWTQWRIQNSACRRFTTAPSASRRRQTPLHSSDPSNKTFASISINLVGHSHRILADVSTPFYKAVVYLRDMSREVIRTSP